MTRKNEDMEGLRAFWGGSRHHAAKSLALLGYREVVMP